MSNGVTTVGAAEEEALWLPSGTESLLAVVSRPRQADGTGVALIHSGVHTMSALCGRLWTRSARELAALGSTVVRFDMAGSGDSTGAFERRGDGQAVTDARAVLAHLDSLGAGRIVMVGHCFGAVPALVAAVTDPRVRHLILLSPPLTWMNQGQTALQAGGPAPVGQALRGLLSKQVVAQLVNDAEYRKWLIKRARRRLRLTPKAGLADPSADRTSAPAPAPQRLLVGKLELDQLSAAGVGVTIMYGAQEGMYAAFQDACQTGLGEVVARPSIEVDVRPESIHSLDMSVAQNYVRSTILRHVEALRKGDA